MSEEKRGVNWAIIMSGFGLFLTLTNSAMVYGEQRGQIIELRDKVKQLETDNRDGASTMTDIRLDVKEIKSKLEFLVPSSSIPSRSK